MPPGEREGGRGTRDLADLTEFYALRWSVVRFPGAAADSLVFETVFHGDWEQYLLKLVRKTATRVDKHAGYIGGYPGAEFAAIPPPSTCGPRTR